MTPDLLSLALENGWGCRTCKGTGKQTGKQKGLVSDNLYACSECHGNRITEADRAEFERRVASLLHRLSFGTAHHVLRQLRNPATNPR